jgi:uncharacterized membrane protein YdbT with pleckstrin-like domain
MEKEFIIKFNERYRLGKRAFLLFLVWRAKLPSAILAATLLFWYSHDWVPTSYAYLISYAVEAGFLLFAVTLLLRIARTYFEYAGYSFTFEKEYFAIRQGYIAKSEISIAYHQIQHVNLRSNFFDQMFGICHLTLVMAGNDRAKDTIVLPAVGRRRAQLVQKELMHQSRRHFYRPQEVQAAVHEDEE